MELEKSPLVQPKVRLRALEIGSGQSPLGWTAPPKGAAPGAAPKITPEVEAYLRGQRQRPSTGPGLPSNLVKLFSKSLASGLTVRPQLGYVYKRTGKPDPKEVEAFQTEGICCLRQLERLKA